MSYSTKAFFLNKAPILKIYFTMGGPIGAAGIKAVINERVMRAYKEVAKQPKLV